ncbi:MAG: DUF1178 family protein [Alphaproteobacteria bacterium]|nr:DUF1178 family protein [Alphaproteobacteria bacterium]
MIRYDLRCAKGHGFEDWFDSIADYERLEAEGDLSCPSCGSRQVKRGFMAPALAGASAKAEPAPMPMCGMAQGGPGCGRCAFEG